MSKGMKLTIGKRQLAGVIYIAAALVALVAVSGAWAKVTPTVTTSLSDSRLGAHADFTVRINANYGATGTTTGNTVGGSSVIIPDPATYPQPSDFRETAKNFLVDLPPGLVGNPNAIPMAERCDQLVFETGMCPASATIGTLTVTTTLVGSTPEEFPAEGYYPEPGENYLNITVRPPASASTSAAAPQTRVSLLKTDPEVPAKIGLYVNPPFNAYKQIREVLEVVPDTGGDLRLRTTAANLGHRLYSLATGDFLTNYRIDSMELKLLGTLANGNKFMTNPTECTEWKSSVWANAEFVNDNLESDPRRTGVNEFTAPAVSTIIPNCTNLGSVPFPITGKVAISDTKRDVSPDFDFTIENPGIFANGDVVSTTPKKIVARVPASFNVDVQQLGRTCTEADFNADACPATSRVGNVKIETPLLLPGLAGDVYLVRKPGAGLPDLGLRVRGAISFTQRGKNRYVGARGNEIETTFDNIPQLGFSKLTFHLDGGPSGLLRTLACPTDNKQPGASDFSYEFTSWTGATTGSTTKLNAANCFGIQKLRSFKCVYRILRFQPTYTSRARIKRSIAYIDGKKRGRAKAKKFGFKINAKKFKRGWHKIEVRATYDDGTVSKKRAKFKKC